MGIGLLGYYMRDESKWFNHWALGYWVIICEMRANGSTIGLLGYYMRDESKWFNHWALGFLVLI